MRTPSCDKMGLKKGPWTPEEDQILISYIQQHGHGNWRALPNLAGLLRCGKSCRLRWMNYLRPDVKRGNFTKEEEDTIINLHEILGNRWSTIAAKLPGRTDNEIKNFWHTHLKKRIKNFNSTQFSKRNFVTVPKSNSNTPRQCKPLSSYFPTLPEINSHGYALVSPQPSYSELPSVTDSFAMVIKHEQIDSSENLLGIDKSFRSEEISIENSGIQLDFSGVPDEVHLQFPLSSITATTENVYTSKGDDCMKFWHNLFLRAGDLPKLC